MPRREDFENSLWSDPDFLALAPDARYLYIWTWTNQRCGMAGIYKFSPVQAAAETGLTEDRVRSALAELSEARFAFYEENVLWVRSRVKHLRQKTDQIARAIRNDLRAISDSNPLKAQFLATYSGQIWLRDAIGGEGQVSLDRPSSDPIHPREGHSTLYGTGTGKGTGGFRNRRAGARVSRPYEPVPEAVAMHAEHFAVAGTEVQAVDSAISMLVLARKPVTVEAVRALLYGEAA